jgi:D-aminoacyl-tRNA deacylase
MRAVIQRVKEASVAVEGKVVGAIGVGLLVFVGIESADGEEDLVWLANKLPALRVFEDEKGRMNRSLAETGGGILLISQFTLYGSLRKGTRPSFNRAAAPEFARAFYERFHRVLEVALGQPVPTGMFGAMMEICAAHDGPVTLMLDTKQREF